MKENEKNCDTCKHCNSYFDCSQCSDFDEWEEKENDLVNHPSHYTQGKFEVIDIIEDATNNLKGIEAVCVANILKYVLRYKFKKRCTGLAKKHNGTLID